MSRAFLVPALKVLALAAVFAGLAYGGIELTRGGGRIATLWLPNAVLAAVLLRGRTRHDTVRIAACLAANVAVNFVVGDDWATALSFAFANGVEVMLVVAILRHVCGRNPVVSELRTLGWLFAVCFIAPFASGAIAAAHLVASGAAFGIPDFFNWVLADGLSLMIVTPIVMIGIDAWRARHRPTLREVGEWAAFVTVTCAVAGAIFAQSRFPFLFIACPIVIFAAFRTGFAGTAAAIALISLIASIATVLGSGPIMLVHGDVAAKALVLQLFLATSFAMGLPVAAALAGRAKIRRQLQQSRDRTQSILDNIQEVVFRTDPQGRWLFLNHAWETISGYTPAESLGWPTTKLLVDEDKETARGIYPHIASGELNEVLLRQRFLRKDGTCRHIEVTVRALRDEAGNFTGTAGNIRDISEQIHYEQELKSRDEQLSLLANNATDAVLRLSLDGTCLYASPSVQELLGVEPQYLIGKQMLTRLHAEDDDNVQQTFAALARGEIDDCTIAYRSEPPGHPGAYRWMEAHCGLVKDADGAPREVIASIRDVSANKALEEELHEARARAETAAAAKSAFLANMSHEIRTPMNGVLGFTELLGRSNLDAEQRQQVEMIADSGRAMMRLLNDLLDMSKIDSGQMQITAEPINLWHTLRGSARLMEPIAQSKHVALSVEVDEDLPRTITSDPMRLRQILLNLIGNAAKFTDHGTIHVHAAREDEMLAISVTDTGVGIAEDRIDAIFQQFAQADAGIARRYGGTGLGLSISADLARLMGGSIHVASTVGKGTTFTLRLPLIEAEAVAEPEAPAPVFALPADTIRRVLIAEDHDINQALITALARSAGLEPTIAANGAQAVEMAEDAAEAGVPFDLVLMDVQMPVMDGLEATRILRSRFTGQELPIVALTANAYADDKQACLDAGMNGHLAKPVRLRDLQALVAHTFGQDAPAAAEAVPATGLNTKYEQRKRETLEAISASVRRHDLDGATIGELAEMLHKLAGTAGLFGEAALGDAASGLEHALKGAAPAEWESVLAQGLEQLQNAA